jgi:hypothetical protein
VHRYFGVLIAAVSSLLGQAPPETGPLAKPLVYAGKPLSVVPSCRPEDLGALGLSCSDDDPCPVLLELTAAETVGTRIVLIGNLHTESTTLESVILTSEDGGITWSEGYARIPAAAFDQIQFLDFENGWISGQTVTTLPRDPFLLLSRNGGKSWRRQPVFAEPRVGLIDAFWFKSAKEGTMTIDRIQPDENGIRYELHQSLTGGDSWMLQRLSQKPIAFDRPSRPEGGLRLQANSGSRSYQLQRQSGDKWLPLAAFAIRAGECRPPEAKLVEPERPTEVEEVKPELPKPSKKKR